MKRALFHVLFWLCYYALSAYFESLWLKSYAPFLAVGAVAVKAHLAALLYILPYISMAYYQVYFGLNLLIKEEVPRWKGIVFVVVPYLLTILAVIAIARLVVLPYVYDNVVAPQGPFIAPAKFFSIMVEAAFPAGLLMSVRYVAFQLQAKEREKVFVKEKLDAELQLLRNQLNPHFLFNTLNNIYALTRKKSDMAPGAVMKLSEMLSFMLYEAGSDVVPVAKEIQFLEDYISLQKIRYTQSLKLSFKQSLDDFEAPLVPLLLLPLVENAFKHGAGEHHEDSYIRIDLVLKEGWLVFTVENSYEPDNDKESSAAIGISNVKRRLELMYREHELKLIQGENVFKAQVKVNLNSYEKA